jgi:hypothetical protein
MNSGGSGIAFLSRTKHFKLGQRKLQNTIEILIGFSIVKGGRNNRQTMDWISSDYLSESSGNRESTLQDTL